MSADNGIRIVETKPNLFDVYHYFGEGPGSLVAGNQSLRQAIQKAQETPTEYGPHFVFYEAPRRWTEIELLTKLNADSQSGGLNLGTDNEDQIIIYTGFVTDKVDGKLRRFNNV